MADPAGASSGGEPTWLGYLRVQVTDPRKEKSGGGGGGGTPRRAGTFISYGIRTETNLPHFSRSQMSTRKRFQDFAFLRETLARDFPACIVPPLPDKHRLEYLTGDRFGDTFVQRRCAELQLFLERVCRHPVLQRAKLLQVFLESDEWEIEMHTHAGQAIGGPLGGSAAAAGGMIESLSDTFVNVFSRVRKPDPRFTEMQRQLEQEEDHAAQLERVLHRFRNHVFGTLKSPVECCDANGRVRRAR